MNCLGMSVALVAVLLLSSVRAQAQEHRAYRLSYYAPAECPDRAAFSSALQSNSPRTRHALAGETAVEVEATLTASGGAFEGRLKIRHPDGTETTRTVPGVVCTESVDAMALIVALTLDPDAREQPTVDHAAVEDDNEVDDIAGEKALAPSPYESTAPGGAFGASSTSPEVDAAPGDGKRAARRNPKAWQFRAGASFGVISANGPDLSLDYGASVGFLPGSTPLSPLLAISGHYAQSNPVVRTDGTAQFTRMVGRLSACPALAGSEAMALRSCAFLGIGQLSVMGSDALPPARMPWLEIGAKFRGEARLWGPLIVGMELGAAALLFQDSFYFHPSGVDVFVVPPASAMAGIDASLQL